MEMRNFVLGMCVAFILVGCSKAPQEVVELKRFPIDSLEGIITQSGVQFDKEVSSDGNGSLKIVATEPTVVRLFELGDIDVENARLIYQAKVRTEGVEGQVFLEMWCPFPRQRGILFPGVTDPSHWHDKLDSRRDAVLLEKGRKS
jgi:hypothetical protein